MRSLNRLTKYVIYPSGFLKDSLEEMKDLFKPKRIMILLILLSGGSLFFVPNNKITVSLGFLILAFVIQLRIIYIAGDHNRWYKEKVYSLGQKKDISDSPNEIYLESRNTAGEDNK